MSDTEVKKPATRKKRSADLPFEEALARLEAVVREMESGDIPLDKSLALYEEGIALVRRCTKELDDAEQRVRILQKTPDGEIVPAAFATTED